MHRRGFALALATILLTYLLAVAAPVTQAASAVAVEYGPWSAWQEEPIEETEELEVESAMISANTENIVWRYSRFVYFNAPAQKWYCSASEQTGTHAQAGTGYWEEKIQSAPRGISGKDGDHVLYEGGWYNEEVKYETRTAQSQMYRSRPVHRITCEISTNELLLFPGKTRKITVNLFDGSSQYQWTSSDQTVARVDQEGNVTGVAVGATFVKARSDSGREVACEVLVCQKGAMIPDGVYTLRLSKTGKTLAVGKRVSSQRKRAVTDDYTGDRSQRFTLTNVAQRTFILKPLTDKRTYLDVQRGTDNLKVGDSVQFHSKKDRTAQYWRAVYVPDGSYIIYPKANASLVLGAEPVEAGKEVRLEALSWLENLDRWVLIRTGQSPTHTDSFLRPVIRDGTSYVSKEYEEGVREGICFASNGRREFVLGAARGTVVEVSELCPHDEPKAPIEVEAPVKPTAEPTIAPTEDLDEDLEEGLEEDLNEEAPLEPVESVQPKAAEKVKQYSDPCGKNSLGKYVTIDHGGGIVLTYAHLSAIYVKEGDEVRQNSMIGRSGATGAASEVGLYLVARKDGVAFDPRDIINLPAVGKPID